MKKPFPTLGMKSSEFLVTMAVNVIAFLDYASVWNFVPHTWAFVVQAIVTSAYAHSRGLAKSTARPTPHA